LTKHFEFEVWHQTVLLGLGYKTLLGANSCVMKQSNVFVLIWFATKIYLFSASIHITLDNFR